MKPDVHEDEELVSALLAGDATAVETFLNDYAPSLQRFLVSRCGDERSRQAARDLADQVVAECFGRADGKPPLLKLYSGRGTLRSWLNTVGYSRLKNFWRSGRGKFEMQTDDGSIREWDGEGSAEPALKDDRDVAELLADALHSAMEQVDVLDLVRVRLVFIYGVKRERLAALWQVHPSTIGRFLESTLRTIRSETMVRLVRLDPFLELTWDDCLQVCICHPGLLSGER